MADEVAMNVTLEMLLDPHAARSRLIAAAKTLAGRGAESVILGCTGMSHHRAAIEDAVGLPVIDPCQAAIGQALAIVLAGG
jgi:Asp/Glu/hydantoin racemase